MPTSASGHGDGFEVTADFTLPDFRDLEFVDSVDTTTESVEETRYDTAGGHLRRAGITLRRRKDVDGATWELCLSDGEDTSELTFDSRATTPPREASSLLLGIRGGERLAGSVKLAWTRDTHALLDSDGETLVSIIDEVARSSAVMDDVDDTEWRRIEVHQGPSATKAIRKNVRQRLRKAGGKAVDEASRIDPVSGTVPRPRNHKRLAGLVDDYLQTQLTAIALGDLGLRRGLDLVHPTRVAVRRLRSTLRVFGNVFDDASAGILDAELVWLAAMLGQVRDSDITSLRVADAIGSLPAEFVVGPPTEQVHADLASDRAAAVEALSTAMSSRRYARLVALLERWRVDPPYGPDGALKRKSAEKNVAAARRTMHKRLRDAAKVAATDEQVHRARKAAKRFRYSAELAESVLGKRAQAAVGEGRDWQDRLGEFQDSRLTADLLLRLGTAADGGAGGNGFTYGLLMAQELQRAEGVRAGIRRALG